MSLNSFTMHHKSKAIYWGLWFMTNFGSLSINGDNLRRHDRENWETERLFFRHIIDGILQGNKVVFLSIIFLNLQNMQFVYPSGLNFRYGTQSLLHQINRYMNIPIIFRKLNWTLRESKTFHGNRTSSLLCISMAAYYLNYKLSD